MWRKMCCERCRRGRGRKILRRHAVLEKVWSDLIESGERANTEFVEIKRVDLGVKNIVEVEGKTNMMLRSRLSFCRNKERCERRTLANVNQILIFRRKTRVEVESFVFEVGGCQASGRVVDDSLLNLHFHGFTNRVAGLYAKTPCRFFFSFRCACVLVRRRKRWMADGGSQTHQERRSFQQDPRRQRREQLEKVAQGQAYIRKRKLAPGTLGGGDEWQKVRRQAIGEVR